MFTDMRSLQRSNALGSGPYGSLGPRFGRRRIRRGEMLTSMKPVSQPHRLTTEPFRVSRKTSEIIRRLVITRLSRMKILKGRLHVPRLGRGMKRCQFLLTRFRFSSELANSHWLISRLSVLTCREWQDLLSRAHKIAYKRSNPVAMQLDFVSFATVFRSYKWSGWWKPSNRAGRHGKPSRRQRKLNVQEARAAEAARLAEDARRREARLDADPAIRQRGEEILAQIMANVRAMNPDQLRIASRRRRR